MMYILFLIASYFLILGEKRSPDPRWGEDKSFRLALEFSFCFLFVWVRCENEWIVVTSSCYDDNSSSCSSWRMTIGLKISPHTRSQWAACDLLRSIFSRQAPAASISIYLMIGLFVCLHLFGLPSVFWLALDWKLLLSWTRFQSALKLC